MRTIISVAHRVLTSAATKQTISNMYDHYAAPCNKSNTNAAKSSPAPARHRPGTGAGQNPAPSPAPARHRCRVKPGTEPGAHAKQRQRHYNGPAPARHRPGTGAGQNPAPARHRHGPTTPKNESTRALFSAQSFFLVRAARGHAHNRICL